MEHVFHHFADPRGRRRKVAIVLSPKGGITGKQCVKCLGVKAFSEFGRHSDSWSRRQSECKACTNKRHANRPDKAAHKLYKSRRELERKYGADTPGWYAARFAAQRGLCEICGRPQQRHKSRGGGVRQRLCVHHDHLTGAKVALICSECNFLLEHELRTPGLFAKVGAFVQAQTLARGAL